MPWSPTFDYSRRKCGFQTCKGILADDATSEQADQQELTGAETGFSSAFRFVLLQPRHPIRKEDIEFATFQGPGTEEEDEREDTERADECIGLIDLMSSRDEYEDHLSLDATSVGSFYTEGRRSFEMNSRSRRNLTVSPVVFDPRKIYRAS